MSDAVYAKLRDAAPVPAVDGEEPAYPARAVAWVSVLMLAATIAAALLG